MKKADETDFGARLREAFAYASNTEIAAKLELSNPAVTNYMAGRIPPADTLLTISDLTNCSIHWLITGQGPKYLEAAVSSQGSETTIFTPEERAAIHQIAIATGRTDEEMIRQLVLERLSELGTIEPVEEITIPVYQAIADEVFARLGEASPKAKEMIVTKLVAELVARAASG